jgi:hypothetical protein
MASADKRIELTLRGLALGCLIKVVFTAANVSRPARLGPAGCRRKRPRTAATAGR